MTADLEAVTRTLAEHGLVIEYGMAECVCGLSFGRVNSTREFQEASMACRAHLASVLASLPDDRLAPVGNRDGVASWLQMAVGDRGPALADGLFEAGRIIPDDRLAEAEAKVRREVDERWNRAVDWLLNHGATFGLQELFWGHVDGLITAKELRDESVSDATIARRRKRQERADAKIRAALSGGDAP